jgi:hypothetical protein
MEKTITHQEFIKGYKAGEFTVLIDKNRAGDFVLSDFADKHNKPAHLFWSWGGIILTIPLPVIFLFINWHYSIISFIVGIIIVAASRRSAADFVLRNMLENESFWEYVILHKGATIKDKEGNELTSTFLSGMSKKFK